MLPAKGPRYVHVPTPAEMQRNELNAAKHASKATAKGDARRRNTVQLAAMAFKDDELPELQEDIKAVMHMMPLLEPAADWRPRSEAHHVETQGVWHLL